MFAIPVHIRSMKINRFLSSKPSHHLLKIVAAVAGTVSLFGIIDVQSLRKLGIEPIAGTAGAYGFNVVKHEVQLRDIEVFAYTKTHEDVFVPVEGV